jgi:threonine/homoserine/homoserine lactone efflux protein
MILRRSSVFEIQNYGSFVCAILLFQVIPGPGTLAILTATARSGIGAGCGAVMGTLVGDFVYMVAAVVGLAAVMNANPLLFRALQWFGVAYLCWIGVQLLRARLAGAGTAPDSRKSAWVYFRQAFVVSLTNPKVVLFFVAFFPLFLRVDASPITLGAMMAHVTVISFLYQTGLVLIGNAVARTLSSLPVDRTVATRFAGLALIGFGVKLALSNR